MGTRHYIGNSTRKEYIDCPYGCWTSYGYTVSERGSCLQNLLFWTLMHEWDTNDNIMFYHDAGAPCKPNKCDDGRHIPWWCKPEENWKNIAPDIINEIGIGHWGELSHYNDKEKEKCICKDDELDMKVHADAMKWYGEQIEVKEK